MMHITAKSITVVEVYKNIPFFRTEFTLFCFLLDLGDGFCFVFFTDEKITTRCPQKRVPLNCVPDGAEELSAQGLFCVRT